MDSPRLHDELSPFDEFGPDEIWPSSPRIDLPVVKLETRGTTSTQPAAFSKAKPSLHQGLLWSAQSIHKHTAAAKLREAGMPEHAAKLEACHTVFTVAVCCNCSRPKRFPNRCDLFYCAECQPRLSKERQRSVEWWALRILQPKHVTLTVQNVKDLTKQHPLQVKKWLTALRRTKFASNWQGGFYSMEVTNEGNGWHIHIHALVDAKFIDSFKLSETWAKITNGSGRIVKVKDARNQSYLREVCKYAVKGNQLAAWRADDVAKFVRAFEGVRTFGVFGSLYGKRTEWSEWIKSIRELKPKCECGCSEARYYSETDFMILTELQDSNAKPLPPPVSINHPELHLGLGVTYPR